MAPAGDLPVGLQTSGVSPWTVRDGGEGCVQQKDNKPKEKDQALTFAFEEVIGSFNVAVGTAAIGAADAGGAADRTQGRQQQTKGQQQVGSAMRSDRSISRDPSPSAGSRARKPALARRHRQRILPSDGCNGP